MFDLESAIDNWVRHFRRHRAFDDGAIREMEWHIRDHIEDLMRDGMSAPEAFDTATREFGDIGPVAREEFRNIRRNTIPSHINHIMLKSYFKSAYRNLVRNKFYTFLNILGLTVGLATVFLIGLFVSDELSFDKFHAKKDQLYRVVENQYYAGQPVFPVAVTPTALGPSLTQEYPEIVRHTRVAYDNSMFKKGDTEIAESGGFMVDAGFFDMFSFEILHGTVSTFKEEIYGLVLCEELAEKYFPNEDPIGKTLTLDDEEFVVTAVIQDVPDNSHLSYKYLTNFERYLSADPDRATSWGSNWLYTYVELGPPASLATVNEKIIGQIKANNEGSVTDIYLQPLTDIYLGDVDFVVEVSRKSEMIYVRIFSIVALFILVISCINFMNLSTARAVRRAKEVGLRKTVGASRRQLIIQFLSESVVLTFLAVVLAVFLVAVLLPYFNLISNKEFELASMLDPIVGLKVLLGVLIVAVITGLIAGSYPALFLSSVRPVLTLNSQGVSIKQGSAIRKSLVVLQFVISVVLIIGTIVVYKQFGFIQDVDLGYNKNNIAYTYAPGERSAVFADEIRKQRGVESVGLSNRHPAYVLSSSSGFDWPGKNPDETILFHNMAVDEHYIPTMQMNILEGRSFFPTDTAAVIINERAKEIMGLEEPVGQTVSGNVEARIVGVVSDFNFKSIHTAIEPLLIFKVDGLNRVYIRYDPIEEANLRETIGSVWASMFPERQFDIYFLDTDFNEMYDAEKRTARLSTYFAIFAILISCLGLFGLVSYATAQRTREIGIRKVLGASISNLYFLLTYDFTKLVLLALLIALPLGGYVMSRWLQGFAYRIDLSVWIFALAAIAAIGIALVTVSYQSIRASRRNPASTLRTE